MNPLIRASLILTFAALQGACFATDVLVNFGSTESGNWNNIIDETSLSLSTNTGTLSNVIDSNGDTITGASIKVYSSVGVSALTAKSSTDVYSGTASDWLTDTSSQSAMYLNALASTLEITVIGLEAGTFNLELYAFTDFNAYQHDSIAILAGIAGSEIVTSSEFDTSTFDAGGAGADSQDKLAIWSTITISEGQNLSIIIDGGITGNENPVISAFQISAVPEASTSSILTVTALMSLVTFMRCRA